MQGTNSQATDFISTSAGRLSGSSTSALLTHRYCRQSWGSLSFFRKPYRSCTSLCMQSSILRHRAHRGSGPSAIHQETGNIKRSFDGCGLRDLTVPLARGTMRLPKEGYTLPRLPRWNMQEKTDIHTPNPHSRDNHQVKIRAPCYDSSCLGFPSPCVL